MSMDVKFSVSGIARKYISRYLNAWFILLVDSIVSLMASFLSVMMVMMVNGLDWYFEAVIPGYLTASVLVSLLVFWLMGTHHLIIRHTSLRDLRLFIPASMLKGCLLFAFLAVTFSPGKRSIALSLLDMAVTITLIIFLRVLIQYLFEYLRMRLRTERTRHTVMICGTDTPSITAAQRLMFSEHYRIAGFLSSGMGLKGHRIVNLPVFSFCNEDEFNKILSRNPIDSILFAQERDARSEQERLVQYATRAGISIFFIPDIDKIVEGRMPSRSQIRPIRIEDLLGREEIQISLAEIKDRLRGKTVLITGAAGSIGSEICRQVARLGISRLVLLDNAETPMHNLRLDLQDNFPGLDFIPVIGDVRQSIRLDFVFHRYRPHIVFHAAAYKHVPLMEENPCEAVLVNVIGSRNVADKCVENGVEMMVMISTDKAVNPTNVMGCSKRLAEIYVQSLGISLEKDGVEGKTKFVTTRFGNVLGSNGSVIPRFREQIEKGGPITVTHPEINRFFMTIPEACRLVLEASTLSTGNQIFVFDMGRPVRIADLARRMVSLAGLTLGKDIDIVYTGLRPGEKLYEELLANEENTEATTHSRIRIAKVRQYDLSEAREALLELERLAVNVEIEDLVRLMKRIVPEFKSQNSRFQSLDV